MRAAVGRAGVRAGGPAARRPRARCARALEKNAVVLGDGTDADVVALAEDELEAAVQVFHVRGGRVRGQRGWVVEKVEDVTTGDLVEHFCSRSTAATPGDARAPRGAGARRCPTDAEALVERLAERAARAERRPARAAARRQAGADGDGRPATPAQSLTLHKTRRAGDLTARSQALRGDAGRARAARGAAADRVLRRLATCRAPTSSPRMVVFEDGLPRKREYRRFAIRGRRRVRTTPRSIARGRHPPVPALPRRAERIGEQADPDDAATAPADRPRRRAGREVRLPAATWSWSTAARRRSRRPQRGAGRAGHRRRRARAGWPSGWRRCGCRASDDPVILPRTSARACTCCSGSATRRTGSRSPTTGRSAASG